MRQPDFLTTDSVHANFTTTVNGSGVTFSADAGIICRKPSQVGESTSGKVLAAPSTPYSIVAAFNVIAPMSLTGITVAGLGFRSSGGKLFYVAVQTRTDHGVNWFVGKQDSPTSTSNPAAGVGGLASAQPYWLKVSDDGTDLKFYIGDGENWVEVYSEARGTYLGSPDQVGWFVNNFDSDNEALVWLRHWEIG